MISKENVQSSFLETNQIRQNPILKIIRQNEKYNIYIILYFFLYMFILLRL